MTTSRSPFFQRYLPCLPSQYYSFNYLVVFLRSSFKFQVSFPLVALPVLTVHALHQHSHRAAHATRKAQLALCGLPMRGLEKGNGKIIALQLLTYARFPKDYSSFGKCLGLSHSQRVESCTLVSRKQNFCDLSDRKKRTKRDTQPTYYLLSDMLFIYVLYLT